METILLQTLDFMQQVSECSPHADHLSTGEQVLLWWVKYFGGWQVWPADVQNRNNVVSLSEVETNSTEINEKHYVRFTQSSAQRMLTTE